MSHTRVLSIAVFLVLVVAACSPSTAQPTNQPPTPSTNPPATVPAGQPTPSEGEVTTASGLHYVDLVVGNGETPQTADFILVHYVGTLEDGTQFGSSREAGQPITFPIGIGALIPGWDEGVGSMKVGGKRRLIIPPELGFGAEGSGNVIPPNATLIFEVELLEILPRVQIEDIVVGAGPSPKAGDTLSVHYTGTLEDGTQFDSSVDRGQPIEFRIATGDVIPGWDQGIISMKVGGKRKLTIPSELAYGESGQGETIPPNATLIFEVELLEIK